MTEPRETPRDIEARLESEWRSLLDSVSETPSPLAIPHERRMAASPVALLAQLEEVREEWKRLRALVSDDMASRFVNASWTVKDLLAHLGSWAGEFRRELEIVSRQESFDYAIPFAMSVMGPNQWNETEVGKRRDRSLEEIFAEYDDETEKLQNLVVAMEASTLYRPTRLPYAPSGDPEERFEAPSVFIILGKCLHDRYHIAQIRSRIERWKNLKE
jgi:hypothetical protein